jgi:hypothetical protein
MPNTPNMALVQSAPLVTSGPLWAENIEDNWLLVDAHDHTSGKGVQIPTAGLNIDDDLSFGNFAAVDLFSAEFTSQISPLIGDNFVSIVNGDLYFNDGSGNQVRLTAGGVVNVAGVGGITGLAGTTAAVTYSDLIKTFTFTQDASEAANIDAGNLTVHEPGVPGADGVSIKSPVSLAASYDLTLFPSLPVSGSKFVRLASTGALSATEDLDNVTLETLASTIRIKNNTPLTGAVTVAGTLVDTNTVASEAITAFGNFGTSDAAVQFVARSPKGGYGTGMKGMSEFTGSSTIAEMGRHFWKKDSAWAAAGSQTANWELQLAQAGTVAFVLEVTQFGQMNLGRGTWTPDSDAMVHVHQSDAALSSRLRMTNAATGVANGLRLDAACNQASPTLDGSDVVFDNEDAGNIIFRNGGVNVFEVNASDQFVLSNPPGAAGHPAVLRDATTGVLYKDTSSARYKKDIVDIEVKTERIFDLRPTSFTVLHDERRSFGLVAEEVDAVLPILVSHDSQMRPDSVLYSYLPVLLLVELKKLRARVEELERA